MGFQVEFNWALKLKPENGLNESKLEVDSTYDFVKNEYRVYPVGRCIDLINKDWEVIGKAKIISTVCKDGKTSGEYKLIRLYDENERTFLTNYWRENIKISKNKDIKDFSNYKIT